MKNIVPLIILAGMHIVYIYIIPIYYDKYSSINHSWWLHVVYIHNSYLLRKI